VSACSFRPRHTQALCSASVRHRRFRLRRGFRHFWMAVLTEYLPRTVISTLSSPAPVPQGSMFGPLVFLLYVARCFMSQHTASLVTRIQQESVRPRWPYDMRPSMRAEKYGCPQSVPKSTSVTLAVDENTLPMATITGRTERRTDRRTDRVRRNMRPPPREEGRITRSPTTTNGDAVEAVQCLSDWGRQHRKTDEQPLSEDELIDKTQLSESAAVVQSRPQRGCILPVVLSVLLKLGVLLDDQLGTADHVMHLCVHSFSCGNCASSAAAIACHDGLS